MSSPKLDPFDVSASSRAYAYNDILLAWETGRVKIIQSVYSKKTLESEVGIYALKAKNLSAVQSRKMANVAKEWLVFYGQGKGYECLFKRLRDTFAHGHYGSSQRGWISIRHRYKGPRDKSAQTRMQGHLRTGTLKKLVVFLNTESGGKA